VKSSRISESLNHDGGDTDRRLRSTEVQVRTRIRTRVRGDACVACIAVERSAVTHCTFHIRA